MCRSTDAPRVALSPCDHDAYCVLCFSRHLCADRVSACPVCREKVEGVKLPKLIWPSLANLLPSTTTNDTLLSCVRLPEYRTFFLKAVARWAVVNVHSALPVPEFPGAVAQDRTVWALELLKWCMDRDMEAADGALCNISESVMARQAVQACAESIKLLPGCWQVVEGCLGYMLCVLSLPANHTLAAPVVLRVVFEVLRAGSDAITAVTAEKCVAALVSIASQVVEDKPTTAAKAAQMHLLYQMETLVQGTRGVAFLETAARNMAYLFGVSANTTETVARVCAAKATHLTEAERGAPQFSNLLKHKRLLELESLAHVIPYATHLLAAHPADLYIVEHCLRCAVYVAKLCPRTGPRVADQLVGIVQVAIANHVSAPDTVVHPALRCLAYLVGCESTFHAALLAWKHVHFAMQRCPGHLPVAVEVAAYFAAVVKAAVTALPDTFDGMLAVPDAVADMMVVVPDLARLLQVHCGNMSVALDASAALAGLARFPDAWQHLGTLVLPAMHTALVTQATHSVLGGRDSDLYPPLVNNCLLAARYANGTPEGRTAALTLLRVVLRGLPGAYDPAALARAALRFAEVFVATPDGAKELVSPEARLRLFKSLTVCLQAARAAPEVPSRVAKLCVGLVNTPEALQDSIAMVDVLVECLQHNAEWGVHGPRCCICALAHYCVKLVECIRASDGGKAATDLSVMRLVQWSSDVLTEPVEESPPGAIPCCAGRGWGTPFHQRLFVARGGESARKTLQSFGACDFV